MCEAVGGGGSAYHSPQSNKMLVVPERFAPFFEHRSISTNSTGAVKTHLADADASLDQKQPFYTTASFVLIHVPLLRDCLLFYLPNIHALTLLKLTESQSLFCLTYCLTRGFQSPGLSLNTNIMSLRWFLALRKCGSLGLVFAAFEFSWRPVSRRASGVEGVMGGEGYCAVVGGCNALVKGQDFSSLRLQGGTARILRSEIGSEGSELFRQR